MVLKVIGLIFSLVWCLSTANEVKDIPFDVNKVIEEVSGEFLLDTNFAGIPEPHDQANPSIAFDGTNYLVVWEDERVPGDPLDIFGTRVSPTGRILDPFGIPISTAESWQESPSVVFGGTNYLVVWQDKRSGYNNFDIFCARVSPTGAVLDPGGILISAAGDDQLYPTAAFDGTNYLVLWQDERGDYADIYATRISQAGTLIDSVPIQISTANNRQKVPVVAFDGTNYLAVWQDERRSVINDDIYGTRVSPEGVVLDPNGIPISIAPFQQKAPSVAFDGTNYLVVWQDSRGDDIRGSRVAQNGVVLDTGIIITSAQDNQRAPSIAFDGRNYLVVWADSRNGDNDIYGSRVTPAGIVLDPLGIPISTEVNRQESPSIAFAGTSLLVVWTDERSGLYDYDIYGARISLEGIVLDSLGIVVSALGIAYDQWSPNVAFDGTNYLAVWTDERNGNKDIYGSRVSRAGLVLDPYGIAISTTPALEYSPSVAFDGTNYLVVWSDERNLPNSYLDIYGARVNPDGIVLDPNGIAISRAYYDQQSPAVSFDGTNYLVVWEDRRHGLLNSNIYGARVNQSGIVLEPNGFIISDAPNNQEAPSVAFDGTNYLAVWQDYRNGSDYDIYGTRISQTGSVLDPSGIVISNAVRDQESLSVAYDGVNYLVVWQDRRGGAYDIYGARVSSTGALLDPNGIGISTALDNQKQPSVAFDGTNYFLVWQDYRNGSDYNIYGARLNPSGVVIDTFPLSLQSGDQISPAIVYGTLSQLLITYSGWTDSLSGYPANAMRIWGKLYPGPGVEEDEIALPQARNDFVVYPNPFRNRAVVRGSLKAIRIYDITGKLVKSFPALSGKRLTNQSIVWNGTDDSFRKVPAGVYFISVQLLDGRRETREIILLR